VRLDGYQVPLRLLFKDNVKTEKVKYVRFRYIRNDLARAIYEINDFVSNWVLTSMVVGISLLALQVSVLEVRCYFYPSRALKKVFGLAAGSGEPVDRADQQRAFDEFAAQWQTRDVLFQHLQALGPALGFLLTVSSLVEALHPSIRSANDLDGFLVGIHVALISTFLGLLMRIIALEGTRVNDKLREVFELQFDEQVSAAAPSPPAGVTTEQQRMSSGQGPDRTALPAPAGTSPKVTGPEAPIGGQAPAVTSQQ
jgi:hypothetical protein